MRYFLIICAALVSCHPKPEPVQPPMPTILDAGPLDRCAKWAASRSDELQNDAVSQRLSVTQVTRVFEAACAVYEEDGPDAAITAGLNAARTAGAAFVTDGGR